MDTAGLKSIAMLLRERDRIDARITDIVGRPVAHGHLSDWIGAQIFDVELTDAPHRIVDGTFRSGPLVGCTVNIKYYSRNEGLLDVVDTDELDYYLVMTGARGTRSKAPRPWNIERVYLFDAFELVDALHAHMRRIGNATSVRAEHWRAAEIYPNPQKPILKLTREQVAALDEFRADPPLR
ncbi:hypothetical protein AB0B28_21585 [Glycomyces sp. NPDC046736]|uniref:hypothetical protein n=1 Tax=Glycomyces sp. NPDC046736 TaxID=3155615 RepID=UPI0033F52FA1